MRARIRLGNYVSAKSIDKRFCKDMKSSLLTDSQDLEALRDHFGKFADKYLADMSIAFVVVESGDYAHIWISKTSHPYTFSGSARIWQHIRLELY